MSPNDSGERTPLLETGRALGHQATHKAKDHWSGFFSWIFQDNVIEVAIGLIIASAFTSVVKSFVSGILLPIISLLPFIGRNLEGKFAILKAGPNEGSGYPNREAALDDGATVLTYGSFLDALINFLGIGLCLYVIGKTYGWVAKDNVIKKKVKCRYCKKYISEKASRCMYCSSWLQDGAEESRDN